MRLLLVVCAALVLAGCAAPDSSPASGGETPPPADPAAPAPRVAWATPEDASVRPGVQVVTSTGQCTSNFVFTDAAANVYLGLAAHCVEGLELGAPADIGNGAMEGSLAYSSWITMDEHDEKDANVRDLNDFALILIPSVAHGKVNPAMLHFGGPTGLADTADVAVGDKVLTYGNSGLRQRVDQASWHEGRVLSTSEWSSTVYTVTPGIPGDSGSGVLDAQGRALGVVVTLTIAPTAGSNGVTHLDRALAYAAEHADLRVTLATAEIQDPGALPP